MQFRKRIREDATPTTTRSRGEHRKRLPQQLLQLQPLRETKSSEKPPWDTRPSPSIAAEQKSEDKTYFEIRTEAVEDENRMEEEEEEDENQETWNDDMAEILAWSGKENPREEKDDEGLDIERPERPERPVRPETWFRWRGRDETIRRRAFETDLD